MQSNAATPDEYVNEVTDDKREAIIRLRKTILENLPKGYEEEMSYGMIGYVVPFSIYPKGYHVKPKVPLPLLNLAAQKNFIALYHMGIYANKELLNWFTEEYPKHSKTKLDMGKGCIRFKNLNQIPYTLIGELVQKMKAEEWVNLYEATYLKNK
ncbi:MAG TPA: DUF1801 domain-containing protein [Prolixibacteraceae bacterium]|nr:DUF1801 domain-containing protein [Prolixibacteraceae bacterium]